MDHKSLGYYVNIVNDVYTLLVLQTLVYNDMDPLNETTTSSKMNPAQIWIYSAMSQTYKCTQRATAGERPSEVLLTEMKG